jgi:hypothetical protein
MSSSDVRYTVFREPDNNTTHVLKSNVVTASSDNSINFTGRSVMILVVAADTADQPLPAGTTVSFATTAGKIVGPTTLNVPNTSSVLGSTEFATTITDDDLEDVKSGVLTITIKTPKGIESTIPINVAG